MAGVRSHATKRFNAVRHGSTRVVWNRHPHVYSQHTTSSSNRRDASTSGTAPGGRRAECLLLLSVARLEVRSPEAYGPVNEFSKGT